MDWDCVFVCVCAWVHTHVPEKKNYQGFILLYQKDTGSNLKKKFFQLSMMGQFEHQRGKMTAIEVIKIYEFVFF